MRNLAKNLSIKHQGPGPMETLNPFLFCVYHKDEYPAGNDNLEVPNMRGNGSDFDPSKPFRMYHGKKVPGFPKHPHRGFETITATLEGFVDHTDSLGNAGRYGDGDLQWMTAGKGIVHGENFPLLQSTKKNKLRFFQIWLNLPKKDKMSDPDFVMHWGKDIQKLNVNDKVELTLFAGEFNENKAQEPTKKSWAKNPNNKVAIYFMKIASGGKIVIPGVNPSYYRGAISRGFYIIEGTGATVNNKKVLRKDISFPTLIEVESIHDSEIEATEGAVEILMLQGREIYGEKVVQYGPFVMNSRAEISQAYEEYSQTLFGGWPWEKDAVVFPKDEGRFALINGEKYKPDKQD